MKVLVTVISEIDRRWLRPSVPAENARGTHVDPHYIRLFTTAVLTNLGNEDGNSDHNGHGTNTSPTMNPKDQHRMERYRTKQEHKARTHMSCKQHKRPRYYQKSPMNGSFHIKFATPRLVSMSVRLYLAFLDDHSSSCA